MQYRLDYSIFQFLTWFYFGEVVFEEGYDSYVEQYALKTKLDVFHNFCIASTTLNLFIVARFNWNVLYIPTYLVVQFSFGFLFSIRGRRIQQRL